MNKGATGGEKLDLFVSVGSFDLLHSIVNCLAFPICVTAAATRPPQFSIKSRKDEDDELVRVLSASTIKKETGDEMINLIWYDERETLLMLVRL